MRCPSSQMARSKLALCEFAGSDGVLAATAVARSHRPRLDCCAPAPHRRLFQQHRPGTDMKGDSWVNVLIEPKEIVAIVSALERQQAIVVLAVGGLHPVRAFIAQIVHV